jgi:post-segregation antitoxin (ccd killing protein)
MVRRMPRLQVYLPDDLYEILKSRELPASELLQIAVRAEIERRDALDATDQYLADLAAEVGQPTAKDRARAKLIVRRVQESRLNAAG